MRQGGLRRHVPAVGVVRRAGIDGNKSRFGGERVVVRQLVILLTCSSARVQLKPMLEWGILNRRRFIDGNLTARMIAGLSAMVAGTDIAIVRPVGFSPQSDTVVNAAWQPEDRSSTKLPSKFRECIVSPDVFNAPKRGNLRPSKCADYNNVGMSMNLGGIVHIYAFRFGGSDPGSRLTLTCPSSCLPYLAAIVRLKWYPGQYVRRPRTHSLRGRSGAQLLRLYW